MNCYTAVSKRPFGLCLILRPTASTRLTDILCLDLKNIHLLRLLGIKQVLITPSNSINYVYTASFA